MKNIEPCDWARVRHAPRCYRPQLLALEDRLPLGDAVLGALLASSLAAPGLAVLDGVASDEWPVASEPGSGCSLATRTTLFSAQEADRALPFSRPFFSFRETSVENATQGTERPLLGEAVRISLPGAAALAALAAAPARVSGSDLFSSDRGARGLVPVVEQQVHEVGFGLPPLLPNAAQVIGSSYPAPDVGLVLGKAVSRASPPAAGRTPPNESLVRQTYAQLPLSIEANQGQSDPQVRFLSHSSGYSLLLTGTEAVLALSQPAAPPGVDVGGGAVPAPLAGRQPGGPSPAAASALVRMQVLGGNAAPQVVGREELPGKVNYFVGNDPTKWHSNIPAYAKVEYQEVYAGIDLVYYGRQRQLEYDFVVQPGADPATIRLGFTGAGQTDLDAQGNLVLHTSGGSLRLHKPFTYQEVNGLRQEIASTYVLEGQHQVGFQVGAHDPARPLVIDPTLVLSTYLGGSGNTAGQGIAMGPTGIAYVTGRSFSALGWPSPAPTLYGPGGFFDAFVTALCPGPPALCGGPAFLWTTFVGGTNNDYGNAIAVDSYDQSYVTGSTASSNFPTVNCSLILCNTPPSTTTNAFVVELGSNGALLFSTYLGGMNGSSTGQGIAVDPTSGAAYVTGSTTSPFFPDTIGYGLSGLQNAFVTKVSTTGIPSIVWSTYLGGSGYDQGNGIALNPTGGFYNDLYVTGTTNSPPSSWPLGSLPPYTVTSFGTPGPGNSAFVTLLDFTNGTVEDSVYFGGGAFNVWGQAIATNGFGCVTGYTDSPTFYTTSLAYQTTYQGGTYDAFVACFDELPHALDGSTYLGGTADDLGFGIALSDFPFSQDIYVTGYTTSSNFPQVSPLPGMALVLADAFVTHFSNVFLMGPLNYSTYLGVSQNNLGFAIAWDPASSSVFVTGYTDSSAFPPAVCCTQPFPQPTLGSPAGNAFVAQIM